MDFFPGRIAALLLSLARPSGDLAASGLEPGGSSHPGLDLVGIDRSVAPGADFYGFANGAWLKATEIPADRSSYGASGMLVESTEQQTAELIRAMSAGAARDPDARKIADYYASFMDEAGIDAKGLAPLQGSLDRIAAIADRRALSHVLGATLRADVDALNNTRFYTPHLFGLWVAQDLDDPTRYAPFLLQAGLDMPDRAYYLDASPRMEAIRVRFREHIAAVLALVGAVEPAARAEKVFGLERRMAEVHVSRTDSGDVSRGQNHWARRQFGGSAPGLDWDAFFEAAHLDAQPDVVVWHPSAVIGLSALAASEPLDVWKDYLVFHALDDAAPVLPASVRDERFGFHGAVLAGILKPRERWREAAQATSVALGEAVGRHYVSQHFPPAAKARIEAMVRNLVAAFARRIDAIEWMSEATRQKAKAKLGALKVGVGYPDRWRDYGALQVIRGDAFGNARRAELFEYQRNLAKLGRPVDRAEWVMTPQTVNAVNLPVMNALNFPAAILQPPYFDAARPAAMDYGAIGAVIGHEICHSFDDQGASFDADGRLRDWWTPQDRGHFQASATRLVRQYDAYRPFPDLPLNGRQVLGENIADVAGLAAAHDAYRLSLGGHDPPVVEGLSGDQQFFISFAQSHRMKVREPALRQQIVGGSHAPSEYRAATVRNLDAWYEAFHVEPGQALYVAPHDRVHVW